MMPPDDVIHLDLPATHKYLNLLGACVVEMLSRLDDANDLETTIYNIQLAVQECCANIVDHAYAGTEAGRIAATLMLTVAPRQFVVELHDQGQSFEPALARKPILGEPQVRGYGLFLMHGLLDEVDYQPQPGNNRWRLVKQL
jgi:serine/threonine-protein kinase RsbW